MFSFEFNIFCNDILDFFHFTTCTFPILNFHGLFVWAFFPNLSRTSCSTLSCTYMLVIIEHFPYNFCPFVDINQNRQERALWNWSFFSTELLCSSFPRTYFYTYEQTSHVSQLRTLFSFSSKLVVYLSMNRCKYNLCRIASNIFV